MTPSELQLLRQVTYLKDVEPNLLSSVEAIPVKAGQTIIAANDVANAAYVIASGAVQVIIQTADGAEVVTARLERGQYFGEQAFLEGARRRNATVRAAEDGLLLQIPGDVVLAILTRDDQVSASLNKLGEEQRQQRFARQSALFKNLPLEAFQRLHFEETTFAAGQTVFAEGDVGDRVYLIVSGRAGIYKDRDGAPTLIATIESGQCFGETAIAANTRRSATVHAETELRTLSIDRASFSALLDRSPAIRQYLTTLQRIYHLPRRGFVTQGTGRLMDEDAATCVYTLLDGSTVIAARTITGRVFSIRRGAKGSGTSEPFRFERPDAGIAVELVLDGNRLSSATVVGDWEDLGIACDVVLRNEPFDQWRAKVFSITGRLQLESTPKFGSDEEVFCSCMGVKLGTVRETIAAGASDVDAVVTKTGCGSVCGSCRPRLSDLFGKGSWTPVRIHETITHSPEIRSFRLAPWTGELPPALPGQHIVAEGLIDGAWIRRSYTLTSNPSERRFREITVKRESRGIFSSWLFREANDKQLIRISDPQGDVVGDVTDNPMVYFVGGIGVTPALAMCRHEAASGGTRRLVVDYSVRERRDAICLEELRGYAANRPVQFQLRVTTETGHMTAAEVRRIAEENPNAAFVVCGPTAFQKAIPELLALAGVEPDRVKVERFTSAGALVQALSPEDSRRKPQLPPKTNVDLPYTPVKDGTTLGVFEEAKAFLTQIFYEKGVLEALPARLDEVATEIARTGTYTHTYDELSYGAKIAWRNSPGCIGRIFWPALQVRDVRHLHTEEEVFQALIEHLRLATNGGRIRAIVSIFARQGVTIWNEQIVRYAGYEKPGGGVIGDPAYLEFTEKAMELGWPGGRRSQFDILPIIVQIDDRPPRWFDVPPEEVLEVPISHPTFRWWEELGLKWMALPALSEFGMDMGGIRYNATPFNGWYTSPEIGSRNLGDSYRYNMLPVFAEKMGLATGSDTTLWRDRAVLESNLATLHSFWKAGVTLVDHHTMTRKFMDYVRSERSHGRDVQANPMATIPPLSGSLTPVYHIDWPNEQFKPLLFQRLRPY